MPVTKLLSASDIDPTPQERMIAAGGIAFENSTHAARAYPQLWENKISARKAFERKSARNRNSRRGERHFPSINLLLGECRSPLHRIEYKIDGPGQRSAVAWFDPAMVPNPAASVASLLRVELEEWMITTHGGGLSADHGIGPADVYPAAGANGHRVPTDVFAIQPDQGSIFVYDNGRAVFRPHHKPGRVVLAAGGPQEPAFVVTGFAPSLLVAAA